MGSLNWTGEAQRRMRYGYYYRTSRSLSPEPLVQLPVSVFRESVKDGSFSQHVDNLISHSRAMSEIRESELKSSETLDESKYRHPDVRYATLLCNSLSPWSKTGAFYYPRYPEGWRGTASCTPPMRREFTYWTNPARYYRYQTYYPRYRSAPRYRARFYR